MEMERKGEGMKYIASESIMFVLELVRWRLDMQIE
jgi:hypothetical protein